MSATGDFVGLTMPVFTAFGWAGEDTALKYALSQLEMFVQTLHAKLSREAQMELPHYGLDKEAKNVYLSTQPNPEEGPHIEFNARPTAFDIRLCITDKASISRGLKAAERDPENWHRLVSKLGPDWSLHIKQSQVDEETEEVANYQDLFKDNIQALDLETCKTVTSRAAFLNGEVKWNTPIFFSRRYPAEQAAAMGLKITRVMAGEVDNLLSILALFMRKPRRKTTKKAAKRKGSSARVLSSSQGVTAKVDKDQFTYIAELKPLHIRKGFINLTPGHWPFFTINARTESRPVTVYFDGRYDKGSQVWRLQPNDLARIVLSEPAHEWLEDSFDSEGKVQVKASKIADGDEIQITLTAIDE